MVIKRVIAWLFRVAAAISLAGAINAGAVQEGNLTITPENIQIGTFFHSADIQVSADVVDCDAAVIVLEGSSEKVTLNRKGRVGFIWMNTAQITISGLPRIYIMAASDALNNICTDSLREQLQIGAESLKPLMEVHSEQPFTGSEFDQFLELKKHNGMYDTKNKIVLEPEIGNRVRLTSSLRIPSQMPPGVYDMYLYCFKDGNLVEKQATQFDIERAGLPQLMINLAYNHAALYGLIAIVIAMIVGIIMGVVFSSLPGSGH